MTKQKNIGILILLIIAILLLINFNNSQLRGNTGLTARFYDNEGNLIETVPLTPQFVLKMVAGDSSADPLKFTLQAPPSAVTVEFVVSVTNDALEQVDFVYSGMILNGQIVDPMRSFMLEEQGVAGSDLSWITPQITLP